MINPGVWVAAHKSAAVAGGVVGVGGLALVRSRRAKASASSSPDDSTNATTATTPSTNGTYDSSDTDTYNELEGQISTLAGQLQDIGTSTPTLTTTTGGPGSTLKVAPVTAVTKPVAKKAAVVAAPSDPFHIGELLNKASGETVTGIAEDASKNGFYALTSEGGVYTSGGAKTVGVGSFLGTVAASGRPTTGATSQANEIAQHGVFSGGDSAITATPTGYIETNKQGEHYAFG